MKLTSKNYFSPQANWEYMSVSQFKNFVKCEEMTMAELRGEYIRPPSDALLLGSLVDEMLTGTKKSQVKFIDENFSDLFQKSSPLNKIEDRIAFIDENFSNIFDTVNKPYADITKALDAVDRVKKQPLMMHYLSGKHQTIMTGEIAGVTFKIKMDSYKPNEFITDLKYLKSLKSPNLFDNVVKYWGYDVQGAVYREIVRQNTGVILPFYLVIVTKDTVPRVAVAEVKPWNLDESLEYVKAKIPHITEVKQGKIPPQRCDECDYCAATEILKEPIDSDYLGMSARQLDSVL